MSVKDLIKRVLNGEVLAAAEHAELENFDPDRLTLELNDARSQLETLENEKLSHSERLQKELDALKQEHSKLNVTYQELQRQHQKSVVLMPDISISSPGKIISISMTGRRSQHSPLNLPTPPRAVSRQE